MVGGGGVAGEGGRCLQSPTVPRDHAEVFRARCVLM